MVDARDNRGQWSFAPRLRWPRNGGRRRVHCARGRLRGLHRVKLSERYEYPWKRLGVWAADASMPG